MISTAVYSHRSALGRTATNLVDLALWVLSTRNARRHFSRLVLVTDRHGQELLVDGLGLPFDEVRLELEGFEPAYPHVWALGKLQAYATMQEPFVHLDHDVICWKPLPPRVLTADVCALVSEPMPPNHWRRDFYGPSFVASALPVVPAAVRSHTQLLDGNHAINVGVFGGNDWEFIHRYVATAFGSLREPANRAFWGKVNGTWASVQLEQYWLAALVRDAGRTVEMLATPEDLTDPTQRRWLELGLTHVWGESKRRGYYHDRALDRCQEDFPADFARCLALANPILSR